MTCHKCRSKCHCEHKKKKCCKNALPKVDVSGPLRVERDEFNRATVIGTPAPGPKHGSGSYFYQIGRLSGKADAQGNLANNVYAYLQGAGRLAEFIVGKSISDDRDVRRKTYTKAQVSAQLAADLGTVYPEDIIDFLDGKHQGYRDHIADIENGDAPLPADFVTDVGILNWWWAERAVEQFDTFTVDNWFQAIYYASTNFGTNSTAGLQVSTWADSFFTVPFDPSGGADTADINKDLNGVPEFNHRFTAVEGDRLGIYCPKKCGDQKLYSSAASKHGSVRSVVTSKKTVSKSDLPTPSEDELKDLKEYVKQKREPTMSDWLVVSGKHMKNKGSAMFSNPQADYGFNRGAITRGGVVIVTSSNFITPKATRVSGGFSVNYIQSSNSYNICISAEVSAIAARDGVMEDPDNLTLIYDEGTDTENVPGGRDHSLIYQRQADGSLVGNFTTIYQGKDRKGLEDNLRFAGAVYIVRNPLNWLTEIGKYMKFFAFEYGMVEFSSVKDVSENYKNSIVYAMYAGFDNCGNIFTYQEGEIPFIPGSRLFFQDNTSSQFFSNAINFPMPTPDDSDYTLLDFKQYDMNPECGFYAAWNGPWRNDLPIRYGPTTSAGRNEFQRVQSIYKGFSDKVAEKGKLSYQDIRDLWTETVQIQAAGVNVDNTTFNRGSDAFPTTLGPDMLTALNNKGLAVGLTQAEIDRVNLLLSSYDGSNFPNVDFQDRVNGSNLSGKWVLSNIWQGEITIDLFTAAIADPAFRDAVTNNMAYIDPLASLTIEPTADWSTSSPTTSRSNPARNSMNQTNFMMTRCLDLGPSMGNPIFFKGFQDVAMWTPAAKQELVAGALKRALERLVTGTNSGTGLDTGPGGRANLNLIQDDGIPLHPGWGKDQRPKSLPGFNLYTTQFLLDNINILEDLPVSNTDGQITYVARDCKGCLTHFQSVQQAGTSSLLTVDEVNGEQVVTVQPHAVDQVPFFLGNLPTPEQPLDREKKKKCCH